jgi:large subunit ribosomal protein L22
MEVKATAKYVRVAPNKARQVIRHIKGLGVGEARTVLRFSPKDVAQQIRKTLDSAVANAEHNNDLVADDLVVTGAWVDEGPTLKRFQPRAMGRAYRIRKRTSHITVAVGVPAAAAVATRPGAAPPAAAAPLTAAPESAEEPEAEPGNAAPPEGGTGDEQVSATAETEAEAEGVEREKE